VIAVNGTLASVAVGTDFGLPLGPAAAGGRPLFHLISATAHTAKIAIAGGSYADGASAITLHQGKPITLQNTADGTRYTLQLYPQGTQITATTTTTTGSASPAPLGGSTTTTTSGTTTTGAGSTTTTSKG
jgi:hypothetical protein